MSTQMGWRFFTRYDLMSDLTQLFVRWTDHHGDRFAVLPLALTKVQMGVPYDAATIGGAQLDSTEQTPVDVRGFLQAAMDAAWEFGLRPTGCADLTNELAATRYHLEDMRTLAKLPAKAEPRR